MKHEKQKTAMVCFLPITLLQWLKVQQVKKNYGLGDFRNLKNFLPVIKVRLKKQFKELKEEDFNYEEGNEEEFLEKLEKRLGKTREEVERIIRDITYLNPTK